MGNHGQASPPADAQHVAARTNPLITRMQGFGETVFAEMTQRAIQLDAVNLGQGFPDTDGPREILDAAIGAINAGRNQYPPAVGFPELREAIAAHQKRFYGLEVDPATEVLVTCGATEAIAATILALCEAGDEVVTFEPYYDSYAASIALAGATRRTSVLRFPDLAVDEASLRAAFSDRTRLVLLNTPHNPTGKVFTRAELELVGTLAQQHDAWVVTDEVYEHLVYEGAEHVPMATLPGMADRTITISSGGKTFSTTGWKVGWLHGPEPLVTAARAVKQFLTFVASGPFQPAIAVGLGLGDDFYDGLASSMEAKRDLLCDGLVRAGLEVSRPGGTYFVIADAAPLGVTDAVDFCRKMPELCGVVGVPVSAFCDDTDAVRTLVRFAFCKKDEVLHEAVDRLATLRRLA
ncbi:MAG TPA: pyridoxal phosphate-dependent aminotransferase [Segeticoccus sp.]|jgi:N-succinyldiaminopimelate aminotransferase|nr:pyridoxal phosphate-dependent aminotransferase [Segeticoccus sp.]